jgi:hypothetical protein
MWLRSRECLSLGIQAGRVNEAQGLRRQVAVTRNEPWLVGCGSEGIQIGEHDNSERPTLCKRPDLGVREGRPPSGRRGGEGTAQHS